MLQDKLAEESRKLFMVWVKSLTDADIDKILGIQESEVKECNHDWKYAYYEPDKINPLVPVGTYYRCKKCCSYEQGGYCGKHGAGVCECLKTAKVLQPEVDKLFNKPVEDSTMEKWKNCESTMHEPFLLHPKWSFCPICARPAPKPLTLREELAEKLLEYQDTYEKECSMRGAVLTKKSYWDGVADCAIKLFQERGA